MNSVLFDLGDRIAIQPYADVPAILVVKPTCPQAATTHGGIRFLGVLQPSSAHAYLRQVKAFAAEIERFIGKEPADDGIER